MLRKLLKQELTSKDTFFLSGNAGKRKPIKCPEWPRSGVSKETALTILDKGYVLFFEVKQ